MNLRQLYRLAITQRKYLQEKRSTRVLLLQKAASSLFNLRLNEKDIDRIEYYERELRNL